MTSINYGDLLERLESGEIEITEVGAFWGQANRIRLTDVSAPVLSMPTTLHLSGDMDLIVYAQLLAGPGLPELRRRRQAGIVWSRQRASGGRQILGINSFAIPDLGLYWQGDTEEPEGLQLGSEFASVLMQEFPDPVAEVLRYFGTDLHTLVNQLEEVNYLQAGTTLPSVSPESS